MREGNKILQEQNLDMKKGPVEGEEPKVKKSEDLGWGPYRWQEIVGRKESKVMNLDMKESHVGGNEKEKRGHDFVVILRDGGQGYLIRTNATEEIRLLKMVGKFTSEAGFGDEIRKGHEVFCDNFDSYKKTFTITDYDTKFSDKSVKERQVKQNLDNGRLKEVSLQGFFSLLNLKED